MLNKKGMTLVEVVIAMLVLASASVILLVGFATVGKNFIVSNQYKDLANQSQKIAISSETDDKNFEVSSDIAAKATFTLSDNTKLVVEGTQVSVTNKSLQGVAMYAFHPVMPEMDVNLEENYSIGKKTYTLYKKMMNEIITVCKEQKLTSNNNNTKNVLKNYYLNKFGSNSFDGDILDRDQLLYLFGFYINAYESSSNFLKVEEEITSVGQKNNNDVKNSVYATVIPLTNDYQNNFSGFLDNYENLILIVSTPNFNGKLSNNDNIYYMYDDVNDKWYNRVKEMFSINYLEYKNVINNNYYSNKTDWYRELRSNTKLWTLIN